MATTGTKRGSRGGRREAGKLPRVSRKIFRRPRRTREDAPSNARAPAHAESSDHPEKNPAGRASPSRSRKGRAR